MPLQNRVSPFGELFATSARGTMFGNRGGKFHTDDKELTARRWVSRQWICCELKFRGRRRDVWGRYYTELFFLDEVTALAAGHRPCFECRRKEAEAFAKLFPAARPRASGDPGLDSRLHGNERRMSAKFMDDVLHRERLDGKTKRLHRAKLDTLPDGAMIALDGKIFAVKGDRLLQWTPKGYARSRSRPRSLTVYLLTPPSIVKVLSRGFKPRWHPSAP